MTVAFWGVFRPAGQGRGVIKKSGCTCTAYAWQVVTSTYKEQRSMWDRMRNYESETVKGGLTPVCSGTLRYNHIVAALLLRITAAAFAHHLSGPAALAKS